MSLKPPSGGGQRPIPPAGAHPAICYAIIDLGHQKKQFPGKPETVIPEMMISWEFPNLEKQVFDDAKGPQPFAIHQEYTVSVSEKSNLYKCLHAWRGVPPSDLEKELPAFLGQPCLINVIHNLSKDKTKTYANVQSVMRMPQGMQLGARTNPTILFNLDNYSHQAFMTLPEWIRKKIMASQEWPEILQKFGAPPVQNAPQNQQAQGFNQNQGFNQQQNAGFQTSQQPINTGNPNDKPPF